MSSIRKILNLSMIYAFIEGAQKGFLFLLTPLLTASMSSDEYGVVATVLMLVAFLTILSSLCMQGALSRYYHRYSYRQEVKDFLSSVLIFIFSFPIFFGVILSVFSKDIFSILFPELEFYPYVILGIWIACTQPIIISIFSYIKAKQDVKWYAILFNAYFSVQTAFIIYNVIIDHGNSFGYMKGVLLSNIVFIFILIGYVIRDIGFVFKIKYIKESLVFSLPIVPANSMSLMATMSDRYFLTKFSGMSTVGIYFLGYQVSALGSLIALSINSAYTPFFFKNYERRDLKSIYRVSTYFMYGVIWFSFILSLCSKYIFVFMFKPEYFIAYKISIILSLLTGLKGIYFVNVNALSLDSKLIRLKMVVVFIGAIVTFVMGYYLTKNYGLIGAAFSTMIGFLVTTLLMCFCVLKFTELRFQIYRPLALWSLISLFSIFLFF